jgi:hypothetical protein
MTSERDQEGNVINPFLHFVSLWQNYLMGWIEVSRNLYENAIKTNEQWFKAFWDLWLKAGNPQQRETAKIE